MSQKKFLDKIGLQNFLNRIKALIPTKTSELQNDSGFITSEGTYDSALSLESEKAVQNKVVTAAINGKQDTLSTAQTNAVDSGITSAKVQGYDSHISDTEIHVTQADKTSWDSKASGTHTHLASEVSGLSTVATSGSYNDLSNKPSIPSKTSDLTNDSGFLTSHNPVDSTLSKTSTNAVQNKVINNALTGKSDTGHTHLASEVSGLSTVATSGSFSDLSNKPTIDSALSSTSTNAVQNKVIKAELDNKANSVDLSTVATTGSYSDLNNIPSNFTPASHTHGSITNDGKLGTASRSLITDGNKKIAVSSVTSTELGYLSGVTSAVQDQLDGKAASTHSHTASEVSGLATVATSGSYNDLANKPTIPTVNNATLTIQKNGTTVKTFTANASSNVTANITVPTKVSELTNDSGFLTSHNPVDSALSDTSTNAVQNKVVKGALDGKSDTGHTHTASEVSGLSTVATSGSYNDLTNKPTIPTVNNATLTIQKNGTTVKTFTANASSNVTANITVPTKVSELTNDSGFLTSASSLDSSKLTGTIDIARLPKGALERLVIVADQTARFALTTSDVQLGDTVKQLDTGVMYIVTDESKLSSADGYTEYTAGAATSVPWSGVTGKPSSYTPASHSHGNIANGGTLGTASRALITDGNKKITTSSVTSTELGYVSGVTSAIQTQLDGKAPSSHTHTASEVSGLSTVATSGSYNDLSNKPTIPTVNNATLTIQKNGSTVKTFTANASSNVTANITVPTKTSDLTNDSHQTITVGTDTTSTASPAHSGTFTCIDSVTRDSNGHVTAVNTKTVTLPADNNTDTLVTQNVSTANENHPVLLTVTKDATSNQGAKTSIFASGVKVNPSTNTVTATTFSGALSGNASTATQFSANKSVTLTGDVTGTASSKAGWSVATTLSDSGVTAGTYGPSADVTGNNNATISVPEITVDSKGRVTSVANRTLTCKNNTYNVYNKTLTIQKNGTSVATFTSNSNTDVTANITVPTKTSELTNDSGFLTSHQSLSNYVTLNGTQTISGAKTFTGGVTLSNTAKMTVKHATVVKGTNPSSVQFWQIFNCDKNGGNWGTNTLSIIEGALDASGKSSIYFRACKNTANSTDNGTLAVIYDTTNNKTWAECPTPDASSNDTKIATTAWVNSKGYLTSHQSLANYVTLNGAQTISGNKTFTGNIVGTDITGQTIDINTCVSTTAGACKIYYCTTTGGTNNFTNKPVGQAFIMYSRTPRYVSSTDYIYEQIAYGAQTIYFRTCNNGTWTAWKQFSTTDHTHSQYLTAHQSLSNYSTLANTVKSLSISGKTITVTPGSGSAYTLTTQDTVYTHPTSAGNKHIPSGGSTNQYLKYSASGTAAWATIKTSEITNDSGFIPATKQYSNLTKGTKPSSTVWTTSWITFESSGTAYANRLGELRSCVDANGTSIYEMLAYSYNTGASDPIAYLSVCSEMGGSVYAKCPTPPANSNDTKIATTAWVNSNLSLYPYKVSSFSNYGNGRWPYIDLGDTTTHPNGFNEVVTTGKYHVRFTASTPNSPYAVTSTANDGILEVEGISSSSNVSSYQRVVQRFYKFNSAHIVYFRRGEYHDGTWNWSGWTSYGDIVTHNASEFLTSHQSLANYSTLANTVKSLSISGKTITVTPGSGSAYTLTTQDTVYTHPTSAGNKHVPSGGSSGQFLGWASDGTAKWVNNPNTNTDTLMTQNVSTTNATYPVLLVATADATANQGAKTGIFAKSVKVNPSTNALSATQLWSNSQTIQNSGFTKGTNPSAQSYWSMYMADKNGNNWGPNCLGVFETTCDTSGNVTSVMKAVKNEANSGNAGAISVTYNKSANTVSTYAPTPATSSNDTNIATTAFVKAQGYITSSSNITGTAANVTGTVAIANGGTGATSRLNAVKNLTNENVGTGTQYFLTITSNWGKAGYCSVADAKTVLGLGSAAYTASTAYAAASHTHTKSQITDFPTKVSAFTNDSGYLTSHQSLSNYVTLNSAQTISGVKSISTDLKFVLSGTRGTAPSATTHRRPVDMVDSAGNRVFLITTAYNTNMSSMTELIAYNTTTASGNSVGSIGIGCDSSGNCYTKAPTPATTDNSTKIATTAFVNSFGNSKYAVNENFGKGTTTWLYINASDFPNGSGSSASIQYNNAVDGTKLYVWYSVCNSSEILDIHPTVTKVSTKTGQVWRYLGVTVTASGLGHSGAAPTGILGLFRRES